MAHAVEVTQISVDIGGRHFACIVEALGPRDAGEHHTLDVVLVAMAHTVTHLLGVLPGAVRGPIGDRIALTSQENDAVTRLLVGSLVIVAADDGSAVAATARVAVPEDFHQVTRQRALPDIEGTPLLIGEVALIGRLTVALAHGTAIGSKTVTGAQFTHQHAQAGAIGIGTSPKSHAIVLAHAIRIQFIGDADIGFHVNPRFTLDFMLRVPDE